MIATPPIRLVNYLFDKIEIESNKEFSPSQDQSPHLGGNISVTRDVIRMPAEWIPSNSASEAEHPHLVVLKVSIGNLEDQPPSVFGTFVARGVFAFDQSISSDDERGRLAATAGASILYGCIREMVHSLSARVSVTFTPFILPTIAFTSEDVNVIDGLEARANEHNDQTKLKSSKKRKKEKPA